MMCVIQPNERTMSKIQEAGGTIAKGDSGTTMSDGERRLRDGGLLARNNSLYNGLIRSARTRCVQGIVCFIGACRRVKGSWTNRCIGVLPESRRGTKEA
jgi:hypothetical protein